MPVTIEMDIKNTFHDDTAILQRLAEIPGTDKALAPELVMLGAHFDSWHGGTGATDNAAGSAVMMEAMRILKQSGVKLRRTVRIGLWGGEEQGLLGSRAYVTEHFGDRPTMALKPDHAKFAGYFNVDNGTGAIRGIYLQGNEAVAPIFEAWMKPFHNMGMNDARPSATPEAPTTRPSTPSACPASSSSRTKSSTTPARITPTWTATSGSRRRTCGRTR